MLRPSLAQWPVSLVSYSLLHQDIPNSLDILVAIIASSPGHVSTRVKGITISSNSKPNSGVGGDTVILIISKNTNSGFLEMSFTAQIRFQIESFFVTVRLQRSFRPE